MRETGTCIVYPNQNRICIWCCATRGHTRRLMNFSDVMHALGMWTQITRSLAAAAICAHLVSAAVATVIAMIGGHLDRFVDALRAICQAW